MSMMSSARRQPSARSRSRLAPPARRHLALAVSAVLCATSLPALALECTVDRSGATVTLKRNPAEAAGVASRYGYGSSQPTNDFDATGLDRLQVDACRLDGVAHATATTDRTIEVVINNGDGYGDGSNKALGWTFIDLSRRTVTTTAGEPARYNRIVLNGGLFASITGPAGTAPTELVLNGGMLEGAGGIARTGPATLVRDGDRFVMSGGTLGGPVELGGGNDVVEVTGGTAEPLSEIRGEGIAPFSVAVLNANKGRFNDRFVFTGGYVSTVHGDGGDYEVKRDALGNYLEDGRAAGDDLFVLDGGKVGDIHGDDGDDRLELHGVSQLGRFHGGYGSDTVDIVAGASLDGVSALWGDAGNRLDGFLDRATDVDTIRFHGQQFEGGNTALCGQRDSACRPHIDLTGFERVELLDGTRARIYLQGEDGGDFNHGRDVAGGGVYIDPTSWLIGYQSVQSPVNGARVWGAVRNDGTIDIGQDAAGDTFVIHGDFSGTGRVLMSTYLGDDTSRTDRLVIDGNVSGRTTLDIRPVAGSPGAQTREGIVVVQLDPRATAAADAFVLAAPITTENGLWQYRLAQLTSGDRKGSFVLTSSVPQPDPPAPPTPPPTTPPPPTPPGTGTPPGPDGLGDRLLAPTVAVVAMTPSAAHELVAGSLADLGTRSGARRDASADARGWLAVVRQGVDTRGARLGLDQSQARLQAGLDLQADGHVRRGVFAGYAVGEGDVRDGLRPQATGFATPLSATVGRARLQSYGVGAYQTLRADDGGYLDLAVQAGGLRARLRGEDGLSTRTTGWSAALSGEIGRRFALGRGDWGVEPQLQIVATRTQLDGFDNGLVSTDDLARTGVRGRLGARFAGPMADASTRLSVAANLWRELTAADDVVLHGGSDRVAVAPGLARNWAELAVGVRHELGTFGWHVDVTGERGLGAGHRSGYGVQAGVAMRW